MTLRPTLALITTGGTIAGEGGSATATTGYYIGRDGADRLLRGVPEVADLARLRIMRPFSLDSRDLTPRHWFRLARLVRAQLDDPEVAGVVITHGTDTLEETAFFLHLTLTSDKPVVMTAAMRPASALSADGPMNLYQAVAVAVTPAARGLGVLVVAADRIYGARSVTKRHTQAPDAIDAIERAPLGWANPPRLAFSPADASHGALPFCRITPKLPRVEILFVAAGSDPRLVGASDADALILALPGNGSLPKAWQAEVRRAVRRGVHVVRASRTGAGPVSADAMDARLGCIPAGWLTPVKARVVMLLALTLGDAAAFRRLSA
jgi:L-asparaginase